MRRYIQILLIILPTLCLAEEYPPIDFYTDGVIENGDAYSVVQTFNNATVDMIGGGIHNYLFMFNNSTFNANGGSFYELTDVSVSDFAVLNLFYLQTIPGRIWAQESASIHIYGKNFLYEQHSSDWWLYGSWSNNDEFTLIFRGPDTRNHVVLHEIPEPVTLLLLSVGTILIRRKR